MSLLSELRPRTPCSPGRAQGVGLFKRPERRRVGHDRAAVAPAQPPGTTAEDGNAQCRQCPALYGANRLPVAAVAARVSALYHGAALLLRLARRRRAGADQFRTAAASAGR